MIKDEDYLVCETCRLKCVPPYRRKTIFDPVKCIGCIFRAAFVAVYGDEARKGYF